jgi:methyltransferase
MRLVSLASIVYAAMLVEAARARSNERAQFARGGVEPPDDVYRAMQLVYPAAFAAMIAEGFVRPAPPTPVLVAGAAVFAVGKALKWWAIAALGPFWTFRVVVVPGAPLVARGPYRFLRHPNYAGVAGELVGTALLTGAAVAGPIAVAAFGLLLLKRIRVENRWLAAASKGHATTPYRGT